MAFWARKPGKSPTINSAESNLFMAIGADSFLMTWTVPQCPFVIEYSARVLDDIRLAVVDAFFSLPKGGVEIGGVLLGTYAEGRLSIIDFLPMDCEHASGPSFTLSNNDRAKLADLLKKAPNGPNCRPVGWYHSHTRSEILFSDADQSVHDWFFPEPWQVALVLKPHPFQPTRAGFFFREATGIQGSASYQEFVLEALPMQHVPGGGKPGTSPPAPLRPMPVSPEPALVAEPPAARHYVSNPAIDLNATATRANSVAAERKPDLQLALPLPSVEPKAAPETQPLFAEPQPEAARSGVREPEPPALAIEPQEEVSAPQRPFLVEPRVERDLRIPEALPAAIEKAWELMRPIPSETEHKTDLEPEREPESRHEPKRPPEAEPEQEAEPVAATLPARDVAPPDFLAAQPPPARRWGALAGVLVGLGIGVAAFETQSSWLPRLASLFQHAPAVQAADPGPHAGLTAAENEGQLLIRWDPGSPAVRNGTDASLVIKDGGPAQIFPLNRQHLETGAFTYARRSESAEIALTVHQAGGSAVHEAIVVVGKLPQPSPAPAPEPPKTVVKEDPKLRQERDYLARENARLRLELSKQAEANRVLQRLNQQLEQLRRLGHQNPDSVK
jgi:proteasome lid subunit RPN8/RPN11